MLVHYAAPVITGMHGCGFAWKTTLDQCSRSEEEIITITGSNFGPPPASVRIIGEWHGMRMHGSMQVKLN